jgi:hypothetical protein
VAKKKKGPKGAKKGKKAARKVVRKSARAAKKSTSRKPAKKAARKAAPKKAARKAAPKKAAAVKKTPAKKPPARTVPIRRGSPALTAALPMAAASAGEVYGEEGWREEELAAGELDVDAPELEELEAELEGPEIGGEPEEDAEW